MKYNIVQLPKEKWQGTILPIGYSTEEYYDVDMHKCAEAFSIKFEKKRLDSMVIHSPEEYDFPDRLYAKWWPDAYAWGVVDAKGSLLAAIETCPEEWSNRLRITELWVHESLRRQGVGRALIDTAKEQARIERRRAIILETQSSNVNAIGFYLSQGFALSGFDNCCYSNDDIARHEVRMELAHVIKKPLRIAPEKIDIRTERSDDMFEIEHLTQRAFWNKHNPGCSEHLLVNRLRDDPSYLPDISRIAVVGGKPVGCIMYSTANIIQPDGRNVPVITFGPLCVDPGYQGMGIGGALLEHTLQLAADAGHRGVIIYGEPDYYPRFGFRTCDKFGITTPDGKNFDAFMGYELTPHGLDIPNGKFYESQVFESIEEADVETFNSRFPKLIKQKFPTQWG